MQSIFLSKAGHYREERGAGIALGGRNNSRLERLTWDSNSSGLASRI